MDQVSIAIGFLGGVVVSAIIALRHKHRTDKLNQVLEVNRRQDRKKLREELQYRLIRRMKAPLEVYDPQHRISIDVDEYKEVDGLLAVRKDHGAIVGKGFKEKEVLFRIQLCFLEDIPQIIVFTDRTQEVHGIQENSLLHLESRLNDFLISHCDARKNAYV